MPAFNTPGGAWLGDRLSRSMGDVETLKKQGTEYIVNGAQECVAIVGNIEHFPGTPPSTTEEATGLTGWGIAVKGPGGWQRLPYELPSTSPYTAVVFKNSWVNFEEASYTHAGYLVDLLGFVHLQGLIKGGSTTTAAFELPVGLRPKKFELFPTVSAGQVRVTAAGLVIPEGPSVGTVTSLSGISFRAEQ